MAVPISGAAGKQGGITDGWESNEGNEEVVALEFLIQLWLISTG
jgi:hypothetical protein